MITPINFMAVILTVVDMTCQHIDAHLYPQEGGVPDDDALGPVLSGRRLARLLLTPICARQGLSQSLPGARSPVPLWDHAGMADDPLVRVFSSGDAFMGELMRGRLEAEGIPVMLKGEGGGPYHAGPVYLWVPQESESTARAVVDAIASGAFAIDELPEEDEVADAGAADAADPL